MPVIDEVMQDFAQKYGEPVDVLEAVVGTEIDIDVNEFDMSNSTHAILMGLDAMMATPSAEERAKE